MTNPKLTRRRFMAVTGTNAAAIGGAAWVPHSTSAAAGGSGASLGENTPRGGGRRLADAVLAAFEQHRIVAIGEVAGHQEHHDALHTLLADPRLPEAADDIVVEFGNALYQTTMDQFTSGHAVQNPDLRLVWRNTTQSPANNWDSPAYYPVRGARSFPARAPGSKPPTPGSSVTSPRTAVPPSDHWPMPCSI